MDKTFKTITPIDGSVYCERSFASDALIKQTLAASESAKHSWRSTTIADRIQVCRQVVEYFEQHADAIGEEITWQMGRPIRYTPFEVSKGLKERALHMIDIAEQCLQDVAVQPVEGFQRWIRKEPLGCVLVLSPWNYPYLTAVNAIIPAIIAGNTVVLKHAEQTPLCAERFAQAFQYADAPEGVFGFLHLAHEQIPDVIGDARVDHVCFTGSVAGGRAIQSAVSKRFIGAGFELGGKDPAYVAADADLEYAVENLVEGAYFNSGQSCCAVERIYVHEQCYQDFIEKFKALTAQYVIGDPRLEETTLGPMVRAEAAERAAVQIAQAVEKGARCLIDTGVFAARQPPYMNPQAMVDVTHDMLLMREESFAPVVGIMQVGSDDEAIEYMNDSKYGLTASIWTQDIERALNMGDQIETGTFFMNRCDYLDPALAWTGVKDSGRGCTLSEFGYDQLTRPKSFHLKTTL